MYIHVILLCIIIRGLRCALARLSNTGLMLLTQCLLIILRSTLPVPVLLQYFNGTFSVLVRNFYGTFGVLQRNLKSTYGVLARSTITSTVTFVHFFLSATVSNFEVLSLMLSSFFDIYCTCVCLFNHRDLLLKWSGMKLESAMYTELDIRERLVYFSM